MEPTTIVGEILRQAPTVGAARAALDVLIQLAQAGDLAAARTLGSALAHKLGRADAAAAIEALPALCDAMQAEQIPPLLRLYLIAFVPREIASRFDAALALTSGLGDADLYRHFQRLVRRDNVVQHEVLKAYCVAAFVRTVSITGDVAPAGSMARGAWQVVLDRILGACRVVSGANADTTFSIGRELILGMNADGLAGVLFHELGHHTADIARAFGGGSARDTSAPTVEDLLALQDLLPPAIRKALAPNAGRQDPVRQGVISMLFSLDQAERGPFLRGSLTLMGAPIPLGTAVLWTTLLIDLFGVSTTDVAVAYSPRGIFHFGIAKPIDPGTIAWPSDADAAKVRLAALPATADAWLAALAEKGMVDADPASIAVTLGLQDARPRIFAVTAEAVHDMQACEQTLGKSLELTTEQAEQAMGSAVRYAYPPLIKALLDLGVRPERHLRGLGSSFCVAQVPNQQAKVFAGPNVPRIAAVLPWLRKEGVDLDAPLGEDGNTLLHDAVQQEGTSVAVLLAAGADPDRPNAEGNTALHVAIGGANTDGVTQLLAAGASHDRRNTKGETPLALAAALDDLSAIDQLLQLGADPDARDANAATPLMSAASGGVVERLFKVGADADAVDHAGRSALMVAAGWARGDVVRALLAAGVDANRADELGSTALHFAAGCRRGTAPECLTALLDAGADIDEETRGGTTPLMLAAHWGHVASVQTLLSHGADPNARDVAGNTPLLHAMDPARQRSRSFSASADTAAIARALVGGSADVNGQNAEGMAALHLAARGVTSDLLAVLLELGAAVDPRTRDGHTPLMFAVAQGHMQMARTLIDAGADVNARDAQGNTPLHYATRSLAEDAPDTAGEIGALLRARDAIE